VSNLFKSSRVGEFGILFASIMAMLIVPQLLPDEGTFRWQIPLLFTIVMLSALSTVSRRRGEFLIAAILLVVALAPEWLHAFGVEDSQVLGKVLIGVFLTYVAILILRSVLQATTVDTEVILAALCVYLLFAITWGVAYQVVEFTAAGSFVIPPALLEGEANPEQATAGALNYFSFVTVTTLGYGDVQPVAPIARSLAITEALFGQIYLVTLIAQLVSMQRFPNRQAIESGGDS